MGECRQEHLFSDSDPIYLAVGVKGISNLYVA
jgi:hypothetical protein